MGAVRRVLPIIFRALLAAFLFIGEIFLFLFYCFPPFVLCLYSSWWLALWGRVGSVQRLCHVNANPSDDRAVKPHGTTRVFLKGRPRTGTFRIALCKDLTTANGKRVASMTVLSALRPRTPARVV